MKLRIARHTDRLEELVTFYRDQVGLPEVGRFTDHDGYDGVFLDIPGTGAQLELTTGGDHRAPAPHPESLLVLYFDSEAEIEQVAGRIAQSPVVPANPYWRVNARAYVDPDGFQLLLTLRRDTMPTWPSALQSR
jgi:catechol 2,3-dioxygenase-like lactoylglutathione lyase family enzyme